MHRMDHKHTAVALAGLTLCLSSALSVAAIPWDRPAASDAGRSAETPVERSALPASGEQAARPQPAAEPAGLESAQVLTVWRRDTVADRQVAVLHRHVDGRLEAAVSCLRHARPAAESASDASFALVFYDGSGRLLQRLECTVDGRFRAAGGRWLEGGPAFAAWLKECGKEGRR
jgi:hypothetical protein